MMKRTVDGGIPHHEADAMMMIDGDPEAGMTMTTMIGDHPAVAGDGLAIPKVIQKHPDVVGTTASGLLDRAPAMKTTMIAEDRAAGRTSEAGSGIAKVIPKLRVEAGKIQTIARVGGLGTVKAIPKRHVEAGTIQTTARVAGSGTAKAIPKRPVGGGKILTTERVAGSAIPRDTLVPPAGVGAKNHPAAAAVQEMTGTAAEAAANMRIKKSAMSAAINCGVHRVPTADLLHPQPELSFLFLRQVYSNRLHIPVPRPQHHHPLAAGNLSHLHGFRSGMKKPKPGRPCAEQIK